MEKGLDYMIAFRTNCADTMIRRNMEELDCAYSQMKSLAIDIRGVDKCITDQFEIPGDIESSDLLLEADAIE